MTHNLCSSVVAYPMEVCGAKNLGAFAASDEGACILPPQAIEQMAKDKQSEAIKIGQYMAQGQWEKLTIKQLQDQAKSNGISIARTKADFLNILKDKTGADFSHLGGKDLQALIKEHKIAALRSKDDLVQLLSQQQAALKQAKEMAEQVGKIPSGGLNDLAVKDLQDMAQGKGISLYTTKDEVVSILDQLEPGVDHSALSGQSLLEAKQKFQIGNLKNKEQLIKVLEKAAGEEMAEKAKKEALQAAEKKAVQDAQNAVNDALHNIVLPKAPKDYKDFLSALKAADDAIQNQATKLPHDFLEGKAQELALKKKMFQDQVSGMNVSQLKDLAKESKIKNWQWANKDELISLFTETDAAKVQKALDGIESKHANWALKHGSQKGISKPPVPKPVAPAPPTPMPAPVVEAPSFVRKTSLFDDVDQSWAAKGKPDNFKLLGRADISGAHTKYFYLDENGEKWLFKPVRENFRAYGDEAAYKIGRLVDPDAVDVRIIELDGRLGSIQRWRTDLAAKIDFSEIDVLDMTPGEVAQLQREHVIDWLISNHDGHYKQFLRGRDGHVYGIDKGQLFKFLGDDRLDIDYHPNRAHGESEPIYNTLFRAVKQGKIKIDPAATLKYIREVEKISDDEYLDIIRPYVEGRFGKNEAKKRAFYEMALSRKNNIRRDFENFYADVLNEPGFRFERIDVPQGPRLGRAEIEIIEEAKKAGWQGKVLRFDVDDIEDQNALIFQETFQGKPRTVVKMKIRPEAEERLLDALKKAGIESSAKVGEPLVEDVFADDIAAAIKNVNHHAKDFKYNKSLMEKMRKHVKTLQRLTRSADPDVSDMAQNYIEWIHRIEDGAQRHKKVGAWFESYLKKHPSPDLARSEGPFSVRMTKVLEPKRVLERGEIKAADEFVDNKTLFRSGTKSGEQYEITFSDGSRAVYRPWSSKNLYAQQGEFEFYASGPLDPGSVTQFMDRIESLGIKSGIPSPEDTEILYLRKQAYVQKLDTRSDYKKLLSDLDTKNASPQERVSALRSFWGRELGLDDITQLPGYDPMGEYQLEFKDLTRRAGYRNQYRFDIADADLEREMKGYGLQHSLTNCENIPDFIDAVLDNNGAMVSTIEKLRAGVKVGGMSPSADMDTGGASYFFTRIKKLPTQRSGSSGLYFKKRLLRRMDAISYNGDKFGRVTDDFVRTHRYSTPQEWKRISPKSGNETIFKYSVTLLDNIDVIAVNNEDEMRKLLSVFEKHGIKKLPDGRDIKDAVMVTR